MMKNILAFTVAILALAAPLSAAPAARGGRLAAPELLLDKTKHDFGEVFAGEEVSVAFTPMNRGDTPLRLSETPLPITGRAVFERSNEGILARLLPVGLSPRRAAPS